MARFCFLLHGEGTLIATAAVKSVRSNDHLAWQHTPKAAMPESDVPEPALAGPPSPPSSDTLEALLETSDNEIFKRLVDSVRDYAIFLLTTDGRIASWNAGAERIKGYRASEIIGKHFSTFYTPEAIAVDWPAEELRRTVAAGRFEDEGWRVKKDGSRFWANVVISAVTGADGRLIGFSKVTRDLTERRRNEETLREREESLRLLVEGVKDHAMFLLDPSGRIQTWNEGARRLLGYEAAQVIGTDHATRFADGPKAAGQAHAEFSGAQASGFYQTEGWRVKAGGEKFWAEVAVTALTTADSQKPKGFVQIIRDLSQRQRVESLEAEGKRISEFIAMLSHELRNPLAPITNAVAILQRFCDVPQISWCADLLERQVSHLTRLIDDLLDLSRVTSGKIRLNTAPLELNSLVQVALDAIRPTVESHRHALVVQVGPQPITIEGDSTRLTQVVVNLVHNAAKYTPRGGRIRVCISADQHFATLQIADNGIGMSESLLQRAFEPFVQGERTLDRAEGGMGIGLTLVKTIVELHGGSVVATSAGQDQGTTVTVSLPLGSPQTQAASEDTTPAGAAVGRCILLVDDNKDAAESLAELLRLYDHDVHVVHDGLEAIAIAPVVRPSVVLLDVGLPGMSGLDVARRLRAMPATADARLIAVTGYGQAADQQATRAAGFDAHATKPVAIDVLLALMEAAA